MPKLPLEDVPVAQSRWKPGTPRNEAKRKVASEDDGIFGSGWSWSDIGHLALDIAGFVPIVGDALDGVNAVWYASQGRYLEAAFSAISIIPGVGSFIGQAAKLALKGSEKGMGMLVKGIGELGGIDKVLSRITEIAKKLGMDSKDLAKMQKALKEWYDKLVAKVKGEKPPAEKGASAEGGVTVTRDGGGQKPTDDIGTTGSGTSATKRIPNLSNISEKISNKQLRHIKGRQEWVDRGQGGYLNNMDDAQSVLSATHAGKVEFLGTNTQGFPVVRYNKVTGFNNNPGAGFVDQPTNVFIIKGTTKPSVVPTNPSWTAK